MMVSFPQVLVVANEPELLNNVSGSSALDPVQVTTVEDEQAALNQLTEDSYPVLVLLDLTASRDGDLGILQRLKAEFLRSKFIAICAAGETRKAVDAMRLGAQDCLVRPFRQSEFDLVTSRCLGFLDQRQKDSFDVEDLGDGYSVVTASPAMRKIRSYCSFVAKVDLPVLILGESGTGKDVVARLIHKISSRASRPFLKVNCAAMPADLLESELFGYEPGAFTGATHSKPGKFEQCNKGTIFLDEIGEMHPNLQAKLLHVLQDQEFSRLGGRNVIKVDVRVLAATNINISEALANRKLREDLYYRLNTFVVRMPPLRERKDEISFLLDHFGSQLARQWGTVPAPLTPTLMDVCKQYPWPGNIRELENFAKRWQLLQDEETAISELTLSAKETHGPGRFRAAIMPTTTSIARPRKVDPQSLGNLKSVARLAMGEAEAVAISNALAHTHWNRKRAAQLLDISYKALLYKIKQYDLERSIGAGAD